VSRFTLRTLVGGLAVLAAGIVVLFTTTVWGLILGIVVVAVAALLLYYTGYNLDRVLKGEW